MPELATPFWKSAKRRGCACGVTWHDGERRPRASLVMQLSTVGDARRLRARAITVHCCDNCIRYIHTKRGRALRRTLAAALQAQAVDLARQVKAASRD
jgi:hypothetical protein